MIINIPNTEENIKALLNFSIRESVAQQLVGYNLTTTSLQEYFATIHDYPALNDWYLPSDFAKFEVK